MKLLQSLRSFEIVPLFLCVGLLLTSASCTAPSQDATAVKSAQDIQCILAALQVANTHTLSDAHAAYTFDTTTHEDKTRAPRIGADQFGNPDYPVLPVVVTVDDEAPVQAAFNAINFTGPLSGDVTGTQHATVVSLVGGQTAAAVAAATIAVGSATPVDIPDTLILRDNFGDFATNMITIDGTTTNPTDVATKAYVDSVVGGGFVPKDPAVVVSVTDVALSGLQTIDGILLIANDRVLLTGQTNPIENGLWLAQVGAWTRPLDFSDGSTVNEALVLVTSGAVYGGSSWVATTPNAIIGTDPIFFTLFSVPGTTTGANVGVGAGQVFRDKTGNTLNFKTLLADAHMTVTNNANEVALGTDATSANTASTIIARDGSGNFAAGVMTGSASLNVLKSGDTMTGNLNMAAQSEVRLQDAAGGEYIGLNAPSTVTSSYTVNLPPTAPATGQMIQASSPTALQWITLGGLPTQSKEYYVALDGSDANNGSLAAPFRTVAYAVSVANTVAAFQTNPIAINVGAGIFVENNSGGPITITATGISLTGSSMGTTVIQPNTMSNNLINITTPNVTLANLTLAVPPPSVSAASGVNVTYNSVGSVRFDSIIVASFQTAFSLNSGTGNPIILFENIQTAGNGTNISVNNIRAVVKNSLFLGPLITGSASNTGITTMGTLAASVIESSVFKLFNTAISISGGSAQRLVACDIESTINGLVCSGNSISSVVGSQFILQPTGATAIAVSGAGTVANITGCVFDGNDITNTPHGTAFNVSGAGTLNATSSSIKSCVVGMKCGIGGDTSTTQLQASDISLYNCTTDIQQLGTSTLNFFAGTFSLLKTSISDPTNVSFAAFDNNASLAMGTTMDTNQTIYAILNGQVTLPNLSYKASYYGNKGTTYNNENSSPSFNAIESNTSDASYYVITGDRTKTASINLISDSGSIGIGDNVRGWSMSKIGTSADLAFTYTNNDNSGQAVHGSNTIMQLDGFNNAMLFPTATATPLPTNTTAKLIWGNDTTLYRAGANLLQTDGDIIIDGLTANRALTTDSSKQLTSSSVTDVELSYVSGVTAPIQTQLDGKVAKAGDTMTGALQLPAGSSAAPSLRFTGSTTTGLSAATTNTLSFDTAATERMTISPTGVVSIKDATNGFTVAGVVHNDASGNLSSSLIVNADVDAAAAIADTKLATIATAGKVSNSATTATSANTASAIVARDGSGNFAADTITANLTGNVVGNVTGNVTGNATTATTATNFSGSLAGDVSGTQSATIVGFVGGQTAANVAAATVLANNATSTNTASALVRRDGSGNFAAGTITANLTGNATSATSATTATTATNFTGSLSGDVTGTQSTTVVASVDGQTAANVAAATVLTNAATSNNTANAIVRRDGSGNFAAGTITGSLTGAASLNVLKTGDSMSGTLNMLTQNEIRLQDASGGDYIGLHAPATVPTSYTVALPSTVPLANQVLRANAATPTNLEWALTGGSATPATNEVIYVAKNGNDTTGNGSFDNPYASLAKALDTANMLSSSVNPITIRIFAGLYFEDNTSGPLTITADSIAIVGDANGSVTILPLSSSNDLLLVTNTTQFLNFSLAAAGPSTAAGISCTTGQLTTLINVRIFNFNVGISCQGTAADSYLLNSCLLGGNTTGILLDATSIQCNNCTLLGNTALGTGSINTGALVTGGGSLIFSGGSCVLCETGFEITNGAFMTGSGIAFKATKFDVVQNSAAQVTISSCSFQNTTGPDDIEIQVTGAGTHAEIIGCEFTGTSTLGTPQGIGIFIATDATANINSGSMFEFTTGIRLGTPSDTSSTQMNISSFAIQDCVTDIEQLGTTSLNIDAITASGSKIVINDSTNVTAAFFDVTNDNILSVGRLADENAALLSAAISGSSDDPAITYKNALYGTQAIGYENANGHPATLFALGNYATYLDVITTDRAQITGLRLTSDTGSPVGTFSALRGWSLNKNGSTAELAFAYGNSDNVGQSLVSTYTLLQLDGVNNQMQLPNAATQIVFSNDTNLYRASANVLKTDDNFIIGALTPNRAVVTDGNSQLVSSITTASEINNLSGTLSSIQVQLDGKVAKAGDTMTGALQLPAGSAATPSLTFTGSTTTGLSAASANTLSFDTNGLERMTISSSGTLSIKDTGAGFNVAGVVHNDASGNLSSSLITNADVSASAAIVDTKLATLTTSGKVANSATSALSTNTSNAIVTRDASGNFAAGTITASLTGAASLNVLKAGDTMTGALQLPAGTSALPALRFTGSVTTGLSAATANTLSFDTAATERMTISPVGVISIKDATNGFTTAGVVHNDASGDLSSSLIVDTDITNATISNSKLAAISSGNNPNTIVVRDGSGNFTTNMITLSGSVANPTDAATKAYVDSVAGTGLTPHDPAIVVAVTDVTIVGTQTIDGVPLVANDRVLLVAQTLPINNGLWLVQAGAWTRPADFDTGSTVGGAYVLILSGTVNAGSSWLSTTPTAVVGTDPIEFAEFTLPAQTTGANVGAGAGQIFRDKTGVTLNFKTLAAGPHMVVTNNTNDVTLATDATDLNTASTIVARDASGNFSAGTITASLTGAASLNVLKAGDSMSGTLNMLAQNAIRFQDVSGGEYVGLQAPATIPSSYTVSLPSTTPTANQLLRANGTTPTNLEWALLNGSTPPTSTKTIYVSKNGNDTTGNGSFDLPYLTLSKALSTANGLASGINPITISVSSGIYIEDNSAGPLTISAAGIAIVGDSAAAVSFRPNTLSNTFLSVTQPTQLSNFTVLAAGPSTATGISFSVGSITLLTALQVVNFSTGLSFQGANNVYLLNSCFMVNNGIAINGNGCVVQCNNCIILGASGAGPAPSATNRGCVITGISIFEFTGGVIRQCNIGVTISNNAIGTMTAATFKVNTTHVLCNTASTTNLVSSSFNSTTSVNDTSIQVTDAGTTTSIISCELNGLNVSTAQGVGIKVLNGASVDISGGSIEDYVIGVQAGGPSDASSTITSLAGAFIRRCTTDILQQGSSTLNVNASTASGSKMSINDPTNVTMSFFNIEDSNSLSIGHLDDTDADLINAAISGSTGDPTITYKSSLYGSQAIGYQNSSANVATFYATGNNATTTAAITTDRTKLASLRLASDTGSPFGTTTALRAWDLNKNGSSAELAFTYQNSDATGQSLVSTYTLLQLDGVNNQLQLPNAATQIVFDTDTNLYRASADTLKTDDNMIIGGLTASRALTTNGSKQLTSSITTDTELGYLSGTTSSVQTQINAKVAKAGDTMTGALQLPAGTSAAPSLRFTGSTTTGLSAAVADTLSLDTNGLERMTISSSGTLSIKDVTNGFGTSGVVHNGASGNLSSSLITNSDVDAAAGIVDTKLATLTTAGKVANSATTAASANTASAIVARDSSGNFAAGTITANLSGNATSATTATNFSGSLSGDVTGTQSATVVASVGGQTAANVAAATVLANAATNANTASTIVRRDASGNFAAGTITANLSGNATTATTATNFSGSLSGDVTGTQGATVVASVGGQTAANVAAATVLANAATSANTASTIVRRDASGNFAAGIITGSLSGGASLNVFKSGDVMTGALQLPGGGATTPTLNFTGSATTGLSAAVTDTLVLGTAGVRRIVISPTGVVSIKDSTSGFTTAGVVHNDTSGDLSSSLIVNADVSGSAAIADTKLATISTAGKVSNSATTATNLNTASAIVARDSSGNFAAGTISANLSGNATTATTATNFSGNLGGDVTGTQAATVVASVGGQTAANVAAATVLANAATNANTASTIVRRDASGNFAAGTITANLSGNATTATTATNFSGSLSGDVTGTQATTVVASVGGQTAANVAAATVLANAATNTNTASALVRRDASGNFAAGTITANLTGNVTGSLTGNASTATTATTATNFSGSLTGDVTGTQAATVVASVGGQTAANVAAATVLANAATSANTASTIVRRDASGNFTAGTVTATTFVGALTGAASLNVLKAGDTMTGTLTHPAGTTAAPSIQFTGSTNTGISAPSSNNLSFSANGTEVIDLTSTLITNIINTAFDNPIALRGIQSFQITANGQSVSAAADTAILILNPNAARTGFTVTFPPSPINGQLFTILVGTTNSVTFTSAAGTGGAGFVNNITALAPASTMTATANGRSITYIYLTTGGTGATSNAWYALTRG